MRRSRIAVWFLSMVLLVGGTYCVTAFTECPILSEMRNIWIETAMTTGDHQWLATSLFPDFVVQNVMAKQINTVEGIAGLDESSPVEPIAPVEPEIIPEIETEMIEATPLLPADILGQRDLVEGGKDLQGNKVVINDIDQGILVSEVKAVSYTGKIVQIDDPSRVFVGVTDQKNSRGKLICDYLEDENAIIGMNASGFLDYEGKGLGGEIIGQTVSKGEFWGDYIEKMYTMGFTEDDRLIAGDIPDWRQYQLRDAIQSNPVIIKDGKSLMNGSSGWGLQPRTVIGQRADGVVLFLVIDGRKPGYSVGATMADCADILLSYGAETAAACDGGSSAVLAYEDHIINRPSTPMVTGRYLPNAFLVRKK